MKRDEIWKSSLDPRFYAFPSCLVSCLCRQLRLVVRPGGGAILRWEILELRGQTIQIIHPTVDIIERNSKLNASNILTFLISTWFRIQRSRTLAWATSDGVFAFFFKHPFYFLPHDPWSMLVHCFFFCFPTSVPIGSMGLVYLLAFTNLPYI